MDRPQVEYTLLEPLIADTEAVPEPQFKGLKRRDLRSGTSISNRNDQWNRARLFILAIFAFILVYVSIGVTRDDLPQVIVRVPPDDNGVPNGYLVWSPQCKIRSLDPRAKVVMALFHRQKSLTCAVKGVPLTTLEWSPNSQRHYLRVVAEAKEAHGYYRSGSDGYCVYEEVSRKSENQIKSSVGVKFTYKVELSPDVEFVHVECFAQGVKLPIYKDVHFVVQRKSSVLKRLDHLKKSNASASPTAIDSSFTSVLMVGIDSISRLNLLRAMPNTAQHLYDSGWFEMRGYNKMGDNTYPNLMAILTGYNNSWAWDKCIPWEEGALDKCPFIWKEYSQAGFVTGYIEDEPEIGTFNYRKKGFSTPPTDFYGRAGMIAAERKLPKVMHTNLAVCLGERSAADYVYHYGFDITETFKKEGTFGLYWTNSFSHNDLNAPSLMDGHVKSYLIELEERNILNDTIVVFFSDHGLRFGPVRKLMTGWMEERLPFLFFWLPPAFREKHPEIVDALKVNKNRLTNPYDLHLTLKHILQLSGRRKTNHDGVEKDVAMGCENCQSMFHEVSNDRSCDDIGIAPHWCTCANYQPIDRESKLVKQALNFAIEFLNQDIKARLNGTTKPNGGPLCAHLRLSRIDFVGEATQNEDSSDILISFETKPGGAEFETTIRHFVTEDRFEMTGSISRLNTYAGSHSKCVSDEHLKMYCECL